MDIDQLALNLPAISKWIDDAVAKAMPKARPTDSFGFHRLGQYYSADLLHEAKVVPVPKVPIPPLSNMGLTEFVDLERMDMDGITYGNVYFVRDDQLTNEALHFHELVHVMQWRFLGREKFIMFYALGHLEGRGYDSNPFERMAYQFQAKFEAGEPPFDVSNAVAHESAALSARFSAAFERSGRSTVAT